MLLAEHKDIQVFIIKLLLF